jgi:deoxyribodipyrimidine photo-lyase
MHNRVRMIVASFLVKHLRLPWQHGARWFWDTLVDADLASNTLGWQWSAGCGADAAPYFRIFAPVTQGERFDGEGAYVRRWVPEIARLPDKFLHAPWTAPASVRVHAQIDGRYPDPLVDHATARAEALAAFKQLRGASAETDADE